MSKKFNSYLTFGFLSKRVVFGDNILYKLRSNKIHLIVLSNDIGETQKKRFLDKANYYNVPVIIYESKEYIGDLLHKNYISALGIEDKNLSSAIINLKEGVYYGKKEK